MLSGYNTNNDVINQKVNLISLGNSLKNLSKNLYNYYGEKVIILIDEYDVPIQAAYINNYYIEAIEFIRHLLSGAFKDNNSLQKGMITGILRVARESIFSGLNNLKVESILSDNFCDKFGFTDLEIEKLFFDYGIDEGEKVYHAFVLGMLISLNDTHEVLSNRESGYGRYDVMIIPKNVSNLGIIIEFKKLDPDDEENLEETADEALKQIIEKKYSTTLEHKGVKNIKEIAIVFRGKDIYIKARENINNQK